jgi:hypothetical protein
MIFIFVSPSSATSHRSSVKLIRKFTTDNQLPLTDDIFLFAKNQLIL